MCMCVCCSMYGGQRRTWWSQFSPFPTWVPRIELQLPGINSGCQLGGSTFTCWTILLTVDTDSQPLSAALPLVWVCIASDVRFLLFLMAGIRVLSTVTENPTTEFLNMRKLSIFLMWVRVFSFVCMCTCVYVHVELWGWIWESSSITPSLTHWVELSGGTQSSLPIRLV